MGQPRALLAGSGIAVPPLEVDNEMLSRIVDTSGTVPVVAYLNEIEECFEAIGSEGAQPRSFRQVLGGVRAVFWPTAQTVSWSPCHILVALPQ